MSAPQGNPNLKWIALSVVILIALSGGVYQFTKHGTQGLPGSKSETPNEAASDSATAPKHETYAAIVGAGKSEVSPSAAPAVKGAAPVAPAITTTELAPLPGALAVAEKQDQCVTITYHHKALASHPDDESCSHHKNMLKMADLPQLNGLRVNPASVCVKVNGTPVHYLTVKGHADELIFGSVAGPKSVVTVRYCTGKSDGCAKEDCTVPKDEFMEAIGGNEDAQQNAKLGQWDPDSPSAKESDVMAKLDGQVKKELETNDDLNGRAPAGELFKDWLGQTETAVCGTAQAKN